MHYVFKRLDILEITHSPTSTSTILALDRLGLRVKLGRVLVELARSHHRAELLGSIVGLAKHRIRSWCRLLVWHGTQAVHRWGSPGVAKVGTRHARVDPTRRHTPGLCSQVILVLQLRKLVLETSSTSTANVQGVRKPIQASTSVWVERGVVLVGRDGT